MAPAASRTKSKRKATADAEEHEIERILAKVRKVICKRLYEPTKLIGDERLSGEIEHLLRKTLRFNESNSALILGPAGCGKSLAVDLALSQAREEGNMFHEVRLDGKHFTTEIPIVKDILDQLPDGGDFDLSMVQINFQDIWETVSDKIEHPVIFVLESFELFAKLRTQQLVYNLFDIVAHSKCHICVFALTSDVNIFTTLDNRVSSRFSKNVLIPSPVDFKDLLAHLQQVLCLSNEKDEIGNEEYCEEFNLQVQQMLLDPAFIKTMKRAFDARTHFQIIQNIVGDAVGMLSIKSSFLETEFFEIASSRQYLDASVICSIEDCTVLECVYLLATCAQLSKTSTGAFTYSSLHEKARTWFHANVKSEMLSDRSFVNAFHTLVTMGVFTPVHHAQTDGSTKNAAYLCAVDAEDIREMVQCRQDVPEKLRKLARTV